MESWQLLLDIVTLLAAALVLGAICARLRQSALIGYLLAGTLLGPNALNVVKSEKAVESIAELGVALLLFGLGLEFSWRRLKGLGGRTLMAGALQVVITAIVAAGAAMILRLPWRESIVVGAMVSLSSTACVLRVLMDRAEIETVHGRNSLAVLLVQDMAVVPLAIIISVLGGEGGFGDAMLHLGRISLGAVGLIVALYLLLNKLAVWLMGTATMARNRELTILLAVVIGLGSAYAAHAAGLSPALGAFVAGMCLGGSPFATQVRADVSSLRTVLLTLFFGAAGMLGDPQWIAGNWHVVALLMVAIVLGKGAIIHAIFRRIGHSHLNAAATGLCLAQVGEFAFVLGGMGKAAGILSDDVFLAIISATIATLFLSPYFVRFAPWVGMFVERHMPSRWRVQPGALKRDAPDAADIEHPQPDVVIIGFGPAGQAVGESVFNTGVKVLVLDQNPQAKQTCRQFGFEYQIGDASQHEVLAESGVGHARVVVIALPAPAVVRTVLAEVRQLAPQAQIIVRSRYHIHQWGFWLDGAHVVVDEEFEVGRRMARHVRAAIGAKAGKGEDEANAPDEEAV